MGSKLGLAAQISFSLSITDTECITRANAQARARAVFRSTAARRFVTEALAVNDSWRVRIRPP